jgi:hypothetical protein
MQRMQLNYIGGTQQQLHQRLDGHRDAARKAKKGQKLNEAMNDTGAAIHFAQDGHQL